jgi:hypothetical protein
MRPRQVTIGWHVDRRDGYDLVVDATYYPPDPPCLGGCVCLDPHEAAQAEVRGVTLAGSDVPFQLTDEEERDLLDYICDMEAAT